jgi:hypothetical protein
MPKHEDRSNRKSNARRSGRNWVRNVKTVSTFPPQGLFTKDAETIARGMASKRVSPKGIGSAIRMIQYFINRAGKGLSAGRKRELEKAKRLLQARLRKRKSAAKKRNRERIRKPEGTVPILRAPRSKMGLSPSLHRFSDRL